MLGELQPKAAKSWDALALRKLRIGRDFNLLTEEPPDRDDLAVHAWAFVRMSHLLHAATADPSLGDDVDDSERMQTATNYSRLLEALSSYKKLDAEGAFVDLRAELEAQE
jgi:hypothetical protein